MSVEACPHCGERQGFLPVQRRTLAEGRRYERYFCCSCKSSFEKEAAGWTAPSVAWMTPAVPKPHAAQPAR